MRYIYFLSEPKLNELCRNLKELEVRCAKIRENENYDFTGLTLAKEDKGKLSIFEAHVRSSENAKLCMIN